MPYWPRIILAWLVAPLLIPATYLGFASATGGFLSFDVARDMALFAYVASVVAVPAVLLLARQGRISLQSHAIAGLMLGVAAGLLASGSINPFENLNLSVFDGLCGAVASAGFWLITRPDRQKT